MQANTKARPRRRKIRGYLAKVGPVLTFRAGACLSSEGARALRDYYLGEEPRPLASHERPDAATSPRG